MFADISGFTPLTEKMASIGSEGVEKLTGALNSYFDSLIGTIYRHGGDIVKVLVIQFLSIADILLCSLQEMQFYVFGLLLRQKVLRL